MTSRELNFERGFARVPSHTLFRLSDASERIGARAGPKNKIPSRSLLQQQLHPLDLPKSETQRRPADRATKIFRFTNPAEGKGEVTCLRKRNYENNN
jgi:hypothetical protein